MVLATPIPQLELALAGRRDLLSAIFGGGEARKPDVARKVTAILSMRGTTRVKREQQ